MPKYDNSFKFTNQKSNIYDLRGKDIDFRDTPIRLLAQGKESTLAWLDNLAKKAEELVDSVIQSTKIVVVGEAFDELQLAYIAGFLDSDGTINISTSPASKAAGYRFPFKAQLTVSFIQKDRRKALLDKFQELFGGVGTVRLKSIFNGVCEYNITDEEKIVPLLKLLLPYLRVKKRQAALAILFTQYDKKGLSAPVFLERAMLVDVLCSYNDSRKHTNSAKVIRDKLIQNNLLTAEEIKQTDYIV